MSDISMGRRAKDVIGDAPWSAAWALISVISAILLVTAAPAHCDTGQPSGVDGHVIELRQYKISAARMDEFVELFETNFIESQERAGMTLLGQFRDERGNGRFTWIRRFDSMEARPAALQSFYFGPVWKANRQTANSMLEDNDDVLLLRPANLGRDLSLPTGPRAKGAEPAKAGIVVATILYLWKDPDEGFAKFFDARVAPAIERAGLPILGEFVPVAQPNNFPALPIRSGEKIFVWFTRTADVGSYQAALSKLAADPEWAGDIKSQVLDREEREPQVLMLDPTPRSRLR